MTELGCGRSEIGNMASPVSSLRSSDEFQISRTRFLTWALLRIAVETGEIVDAEIGE